MTQQAWEHWTRRLGYRLRSLIDGDTIIWEHGAYYVQCQSAVDDLHLDAVANRNLPPESLLSGEQEERLVALGWQPPRPPGYLNFHVTQHLPFSAEDGQRLASLVAGALRDVYGVAGPDRIEEKSFQA